jgi:dihydroorotate dehydrogenase
MEWSNVVGDFEGLVQAVVDRTSLGSVSRELVHDKATIKRWLSGGYPTDARDVAALLRLALRSGIEISPFQTFESIYDFSPMLSYEEKIEVGPPSLLWLANPAIGLPEFSATFCGLKADSPLGIASSPLLADEKWASLMLNLGFGFSTLKTRRSKAKPPWDPPHIAFVLEPPSLIKYEACSPPEVEVTFNRSKVNMPVPNLVNSLGVPSDSQADWQVTYERIHRHARGGLVGLSVIAEGENQQAIIREVELGVAAAADVNPPFIELNVSCPNLERKVNLYEDVTLMAEVCGRARRITKSKEIVLVLKLAHLTESKMKGLLEKVGKQVDAVSLRNTIRVRPVTRDRESRLHPAFAGREFGGLSGPCTFQATLRGIQSLTKIKNQLRQEFGIVAVGGVASYSDVVELLNAGADIVQACTAPMFDPLLALKVRYHLSKSSSILKKKDLPLGAAGGLLLPRDQTEKDSYRELEEAVKEIQRRRPDSEIPYRLMVTKWNAWMATRSTGIDTGVARRVATGRRKAEWIQELL